MEVPEFANESNIQDARSLFKELENRNCLGIDCFGVLKEILTKTEQRGLLGEVQQSRSQSPRCFVNLNGQRGPLGQPLG